MGNEAATAIKEGHLPVVCIQEHGKAGDWYNDGAGSLVRQGWKCCGAAALRTCANGTSAGVAVLVPACVEVRLAPGQSGWDISPTGSAGRLCLMLAKLGKLGWVAVFSAYLWTGVTLGDARSARIFDAITIWVKTLRLPWLVGADWQNTPEHLDASLWQQLVSGSIFAPGGEAGGTCRSGGTERTIDFFWGDQRLERMVTSVAVNGDAPFSPHKPVVLTTAAAWRGLLVRVAVRPQALPQCLPLGCAARPPQYDGAEAVATQADLDAAWLSFNETAEEELRGLLQMDKASFALRGQGPAAALQVAARLAARAQWHWAEQRLPCVALAG